jgi:hypothetical protein
MIDSRCRSKPRPLTLLAGVAGGVPRVALGTAVLMPALRNPVLLAHQVATLDQVFEGTLHPGRRDCARRTPATRDNFLKGQRLQTPLDKLCPSPAAIPLLELNRSYFVSRVSAVSIAASYKGNNVHL